jgi:TrmH family RNA methyltransferase
MPRFRKRYGLAFTEGLRSVRAALEGGASVVEVVIADSAALDVADALPLQGLPAFLVTDNEFARLSDVQTDQGILATFRLETRVFDPRKPGLKRVVVLDGVQDPGNVGTIIRTAAWYGVDAVVGGPGTADFYNPKTVRATMGSLWSTSVYTSEDVSALVTELNEAGFRTFAAAAGVSDPVVRETGSIAVVFGSEAHGISPDVLERTQKVVSVPRGTDTAANIVESLNVSVAAGIVLDRLFGQSATD